MKTIKFRAIVLLSIAIVFISKSVLGQNIGYDFNSPTKKTILPSVLQEISGLTDIGPTTIACVQDEHGIIFIYDFESEKITDKIKFAEDGDYEGITKVGNTVYVLRSDGVLFEISQAKNGSAKVENYQTNIEAKDNEGLCYDKQNNRLLIGSKSKSGKGSAFQDFRSIHSFNLTTKKMDNAPVFELNKNDVLKFAAKNNIVLPTKTTKKSDKPVIDFKMGISGIAFHPITGDFYVLCAVDYLVLIYDKALKLKNIQLLDPKKHPQAEGITFYENGDMIISNEGKGMQPTLLLFDYKLR